jgi:hypothetical protein
MLRTSISARCMLRQARHARALGSVRRMASLSMATQTLNASSGVFFTSAKTNSLLSFNMQNAQSLHVIFFLRISDRSIFVFDLLVRYTGVIFQI